MIFKIVKTVHDDGRVNHGVSLFYDGDSEKQDAVIVSGVSYVAASKLYNDLNEALAKSGMVKQGFNKAANDSAAFEQNSQLLVAQKEAIKLRRMAWLFGMLSLTTWFNHYILHLW